MRTITINLGRRSYPIVVGNGIGPRIPALLRKRFPHSRFFIVTDSVVERVLAPTLSAMRKALAAQVYVFRAGEQSKSIQTWKRILDSFFVSGLERSSVAIAFGGGVVGDVTGFAAATFMRGISFVQVPTTLLAMVDSAVGGKTAINHSAGKNLIGAFHQPSMVVADVDFLHSLPQRQFLAGCAELIKYAFIGGREMFDFIRHKGAKILSRHSPTLIEGIERGLRIKAAIVASDEREETGQRALLNFGHTFAHALEKSYCYRGIIHGEAVLWGILCACDLGRRMGTIPAREWPLYKEILNLLPLPQLRKKVEPLQLMNSMKFDKKVLHGQLRFILPETAGLASIYDRVPLSRLRETLRTVFA